MRDDLIDEEEVKESQAEARRLKKIVRHAEHYGADLREYPWPAGSNAHVPVPVEDYGKYVPISMEGIEKACFENWPGLEDMRDRQQKEADAAEAWEAEFRAAHPELEGLISVGVITLDGRANIGYPGGTPVFNVNGGLICYGRCVRPWGMPGDHQDNCPLKYVCPPPVSIPTAGNASSQPIDKKGWKGHEFYGYDSDVD